MAKDVPCSRFSYFSSRTQQTDFAPTWDELPASQDVEKFFPESAPSKDDVWWLDVSDPSPQDVEDVSQILSIHPLTAEDVVARETREKVEVFRDYYLISFQTLVPSEAEDETPSSAGVYILVFRQGAVTFSPRDSGHVARVRNRIRKMHAPSVLSVDWICYAMMYATRLWDYVHDESRPR